MKKLSPRVWLTLVLVGLVGQFAWTIENMYFNVYLYHTISTDPGYISAMVGWSAAAATLTTLLMGALSDRLGKRFVDLDEEIVRAAGCSIPDLFAAEGEDGFRAREAEQTARFAREGRQVLSCGGGVVKRPENLRALRQNGVVLFIDRPLDALTVGGGRPLSTSAEALKTMEAQRRPLYLAASDAVIPNETTVADAVAAALEALDAIFVH